MTDNLNHKVISGTVWAAVDRLGNMGVQFVVNMVLAWLVTPGDFALIGILGIFIAVSTTLLDGGFVSALIQDKEPSQSDFSTIFYCNSGLSLILYLLIFVSAPAIARWFDIAELGPVLRGTALVLIVNALSLVQTARLRREFRFRTLAICDLSSAVIAGVIAIVMARRGAGVWALVTLTVATAALRTAALWIMSRWRPSGRFSLSSFRRMFSFGGYILGASILQEIANNIQGVIIGKRAPVEMGYYNQAQKLNQVTAYNLPNILVQVLFPFYTNIREDRSVMQATIANNVSAISWGITLILGILIWIAEPLILRLYGPQWIPAVPYFRIFCVSGVFMCLQNINFYAVASLGRSKELFFWSFYKWGIQFFLVACGSIWGVEGILWSMVISNLNIYLVNAWLVNRFIGLRVWSQLRGILPGLTCALPAMAAVWQTSQWIALGPWLQALMFTAVYAVLSAIFRLRAPREIVVAAKDWLRRRHSK